MTRKLSILTIIIMFFAGLTFSQTSIKKDCRLKIEKGKIEKVDKQTFWVILATLTNQTKDTLKYFSMTCSWQDFYSVDNSKLQVEGTSCDKNIPTILTLAPGQSSTVEVKLLISQTMDASTIDFKIGFNIMKVKSSADKFDFNEQTKKKNVIWSNIISM